MKKLREEKALAEQRKAVVLLQVWGYKISKSKGILSCCFPPYLLRGKPLILLACFPRR